MTKGRKQGFAGMDPARQREIASMGGKAVKVRSFSKDRELARRAGSKGGRAVPADKRTFSRDRAAASVAGRKGGLAVPAAKRSFSVDREHAAAAGRLGGQNSHNKT